MEKIESESTSGEVGPITHDMIKRLRVQGKRDEADALLRRFRENSERMKQQDKKKLLHVEREQKGANGVCTVLHCKEPTIDGWRQCLRCRRKAKAYRE